MLPPALPTKLLRRGATIPLWFGPWLLTQLKSPPYRRAQQPYYTRTYQRTHKCTHKCAARTHTTHYAVWGISPYCVYTQDRSVDPVLVPLYTSCTSDETQVFPWSVSAASPQQFTLFPCDRRILLIPPHVESGYPWSGYPLLRDPGHPAGRNLIRPFSRTARLSCPPPPPAPASVPAGLLS